jgi:Co/Zn/Cd efflux system component
MFLIEISASALSGSASLAADAVDFAGDAGNYALSIAALAAGGLWASRLALGKGLAMAAYGIGVVAFAGWRVWLGGPPEPITMGVVGTMALAANLGVAWLLYAYRDGDANMRAVWLCTRNDAISNLAVLAAAAGVVGTSSAWPDIMVALLMAGLAINSAAQVVAHARVELRQRSEVAA